ncbi:ATP-binding protein [Patescibacteria group bacterium]
MSIALEDELRLEHASILLPVGEEAFIAPEEIAHKEKHKKKKKSPSVYRKSPLIKSLLKEKEILVLDELDRRVANARVPAERKKFDKIRKDLEAIDGYVAVPVATKKGVEAILILSNKLSGEPFSQRDIQLLEVIGPQMASGIEKARLYQEEKEFAVTLKKEVEKATAELQVANGKLTELDKAKSEFMSIASHQLRTPLAGIMGYLSMIISGDYGKINKSQEPIIKDVLEATQRLIRMVNVFLNVTRIEAGRFVMNYKKVPFHEIIEDMYKELKPTADKKNVKLIFKKEKLPEVEVDVDKIKDVALNLIDNAIKYSPEGKVTVWGEATKKSVIFHVKDTGVGIPKEEVDNLFNKFVRGSGIAQVDPSGAGLGLFIAKKITEGHGGKIWAESEGEGKGSTFNFEIPLKADAKAKKKTQEFKAQAKKK